MFLELCLCSWVRFHSSFVGQSTSIDTRFIVQGNPVEVERMVNRNDYEGASSFLGCLSKLKVILKIIYVSCLINLSRVVNIVK